MCRDKPVQASSMEAASLQLEIAYWLLRYLRKTNKQVGYTAHATITQKHKKRVNTLSIWICICIKYYMPKKRKNRKQRHVIKVNCKSTNQNNIHTYSRWFEFFGCYKIKRTFVSGKLPGYFTQEYELAYRNRKEDKRKV